MTKQGKITLEGEDRERASVLAVNVNEARRNVAQRQAALEAARREETAAVTGLSAFVYAMTKGLGGEWEMDLTTLALRLTKASADDHNASVLEMARAAEGRRLHEEATGLAGE